METHTPITRNLTSNDSSSEVKFSPGASVVYGLHGKCSVLDVLTRQVGGDEILFYKLEIQKSSLSRSNRQEPAIFLPVLSAKDRGLRAPMSRSDAEEAITILGNREYYFSLQTPWTSIQPELEASIRSEGGLGLAKVASYLYVLRRKQIVPSAEVVKFHESVNKVLLRELSDALGESIKALEDRIQKGFRQKLIPDS